MATPADRQPIETPIGPPLISEPDPIGRWQEKYPGTTLGQLRTLDDELFRNVLALLRWAQPPSDDDDFEDDQYEKDVMQHEPAAESL